MTQTQPIEPPDMTGFTPDNPDPETRYGLPQKIRFCSKCVISNQRPNSTPEFLHTSDSKKTVIAIDEDGVCDACRVAEEKETIDWEAREAELRELCDRHRRNDGHYDCIAPGSGGKDSFYASHILKYEYGMHPLTVTWAPHIYTEWGWRNFQKWIHSGFDNMLITPNGRVHRLLTRLAFEKLFHPFQPFVLGQKNLGPRMSALHNVPLVFYGENEAEYGNPKSDNESALRDQQFYAAMDKEKFHLSGVSIAELAADYGITDNDLDFYLPADPESLQKAKTEVHYLGYYLKWHPQGCYYYSVEHGGFEPSPMRTPGTYSKYNSIDDRIDDFHYFTSFIKFGIGRATADAAQEIRSGELTRDEGVALVRRYDGEFPERFADEIFKYISIGPEEFGAASGRFDQPVMNRAFFDRLTNRFRSPHIWKHENGDWALRNAVWRED
ncbi:MAG: N-acetyl sugar amidotransferase [Rhodospirillales bacterium]|nr:N-acetyl sugar amidotransferase [Rhodospirillales bacterium]